MITRDPLKPWKTAGRVLGEAKRRGFHVFVALDDRTSVEDAVALSPCCDVIRSWKSEGHCEDAYALVPEVADDWIFLVSDDEEPSDLCWRLAGEPPFTARFGIPVIPILGRKMWRPDLGFQERLFPREGWRWEGGFEGHSESPHRSVAIGSNPGVIIWHRYLEAPREEREEKAARYAAIGPGDHRERLIYEEHPEGLVDIPEYIARHLPPKVRTN